MRCNDVFTEYTNSNSVSHVNITSFIAEQYAATAIYGPLALPWFADYMHLVFWFFFLCTFILTLWLVLTFSTLIRGSDLRFISRETRGFSRAQTGDWVTAVIPMCWSITMIMHANVHSSNFDENTDSTNLIVTIIAYQWGWNYFYPTDIFRPKVTSVQVDHNDTAVIQTTTTTTLQSGKTVNYNLPIVCHSTQHLLPVIPHSLLNIDTKFDTNTTYNCTNRVCNFLITPNLLEDLDDSFIKLTWLSELSTARKAGFLSTKTSLVGGLTTRFRLTSGVSLPTDTPIHIICGSQDVIHSWAVPGLLIKIDCIPGYNCHRRLLIRWRGLFWGQCMEVCGRYHHWMPLLLKTSSWEVFSLWLTTLSQNL